MDDSTNRGDQEDTANQQERLLPIANVGRIMKQILPQNAKISKEAKETMQECASEFISFVTGEASEKCKKERRKTVNGDDVCWAMGTLGFDDYAPPLKRYLDRYREVEDDRLASTPQRNEEEGQPSSSTAEFGFNGSNNLKHNFVMDPSSMIRNHVEKPDKFKGTDFRW
ncbi:hypothetical protein OSB04_010871 [Centaurea solstitialis]|uniref:Transcription factor CBF/NF-Y/archaeal histone domain-containing protein n=1 Tax=Centaurea solstitialis TaxID=347529 RepID=A0AA38TRG3_9ASTR|nr:hypothetical protein OSB04_010871 [Centaurea solstitialis]